MASGFLARAFHRNISAPPPPPLVHLLPASGKQLRTRVEPRLAELVGTIVASLRAAGLQPVPVTDPHGRHWAPAYVLGSLTHDGGRSGSVPRLAVAEVVLDGSGRMVRNHPVEVIGGVHRLMPVSCPSLADRYEQFIDAVRAAEEPRGEDLVLTRHGDLVIAGPGNGPVALADYLGELGRTAAGHRLLH
ncbi:hypothetical protein FDW83_07330 [Pseudarthrobacter sp. NamE2]|uniref:hypothetical protein n=1 Tax=Pseudarthrobacter sp. NamE2 TaxID=2576838 RepID=UPI0010FD4FB6|nr:hypothetical protein [Pseudarthrobacter sp. NamE2]TLM84522.1 hypothetical protein FDW83_07330 [Pseudarthrobacter sp. NamE2]